jgi:hypothetical protein
LKVSGYSTLMSGKWYVGDDSTRWLLGKRFWPLLRQHWRGEWDYYVIKQVPKTSVLSM